MTTPYYPVFLELRDRPVVVIGGGPIAQRKVTVLLKAGARVTVISPKATTRLAAHASARRVRWVRRLFRPSDLSGAWLVIASADDQRVNDAVYRAATRQRIFTNVVDQKPLCSFIAPAIFRRGDLTIAISTGGASPAIAKQLRKDLARVVGREYAVMARLLNSLRPKAKRALRTFRERKRYFDHLVGGDVFKSVKQGKVAYARQQALRVLKRHVAGSNGQH